MSKIESRSIGYISGYYGGLLVTEHEGKYYWIIESYGIDLQNLSKWEEIDKTLYDALIKHDDKLIEAYKNKTTKP